MNRQTKLDFLMGTNCHAISFGRRVTYSYAALRIYKHAVKFGNIRVIHTEQSFPGTEVAGKKRVETWNGHDVKPIPSVSTIQS